MLMLDSLQSLDPVVAYVSSSVFPSRLFSKLYPAYGAPASFLTDRCQGFRGCTVAQEVRCTVATLISYRRYITQSVGRKKASKIVLKRAHGVKWL